MLYLYSQLNLNKGNNRILVQMGCSELSNSAIFVRLTDKNGNPVTNVTFDSKYANYEKGGNKNPTYKELPAEVHFKNEIKENPNELLNYILLYYTYSHNGKKQQKLELMKEASEKFPKSSLIKSFLIRSYSSVDNETDMSKELEALKELAPESYQALTLVFEEKMKKEEHDEYVNLTDKMLATFLNGLIHIGEKQFGGGRAGARASTGITEQLICLGFESGRMKTGTPPRVDGRSIDYTKLEEQPGDENPSTFSFKEEHKLTNQRSCYIGYTNQNVHDILQTGFEKSPMFAGRIQGLGPRYCPSIEDKIVRFSERERHQLFVEPEGWNTCEIYLNGFSTSLPEDVQQEAMQLIPGFENAKMFRPGYAIEYDFFQPTQLNNTLETKLLPNLYFAGQINGTTGYEEAGGQGLMAGINAHLKINNKAPFVLKRDEAYIGVLIDDLITKGTSEPYRMFTSRAEYRILLRQDNADIRLTEMSYKLGLAREDRLRAVEKKAANINQIISSFTKTSLVPEEVNDYLAQQKSSPLKQKVKANTVVTRPNITVLGLKNNNQKLNESLNDFSEIEIENAEILMKYEGYIKREKEVADKLMRLENIKIYTDIDYSKLSSLSAEAVDKLSKVKPATIGQASRISGISPSDVSVLMVHHGR